MTGCRINKPGIPTILRLRSACMNVKTRNKPTETKYSASYGPATFKTNHRWFRTPETSRHRRSNGSAPKDTRQANKFTPPPPLKSDYTYVCLFLYMYIAPWQGQTTPWGQNYHFNTNLSSLWSFVVSFFHEMTF